MKKLQNKYKELLECTMQYLWREWSSIGVAGALKDSGKSGVIVDPEPLLLFSFSICRHDPRLFDEIMDWLNINGQFINVQRLITFQEKYQFNSGPQLSAAAAYLSKNKEYQLKWKKLSSLYKEAVPKKLFLTMTDKEIPVGIPDPVFIEKGLLRNVLKLRNYSKEFPQTGISSLILRMRALFGVNARSELITLMGSTTEIYPAEAARLTGYEKRSIQSILLELSKSGIIESRMSGKEKYYRLVPGTMTGLLPEDYKWINKSPFFKGLEILLSGIRNSLSTADRLILSSELRRYAKEGAPFFNDASIGFFLSDSKKYPGEQYVDVFIDDLGMIIRKINEL